MTPGKLIIQFQDEPHELVRVDFDALDPMDEPALMQALEGGSAGRPVNTFFRDRPCTVTIETSSQVLEIKDPN